MRIWNLKTTSEDMLALDFLRFFASAGIVIHHAHHFFWKPGVRAEMIRLSEGLALFVDLFFVISGFVIAAVYSGRVQSPAQFARFFQRRIGRLYPLHLLTFALSIAFWAVVTRFTVPEHLPSTDPTCLALTAALLHAELPCGNGNYFNGVNWSISAEMAMYALFPLLSLAARHAPRLALAATILLIASLLLVSEGMAQTVTAWTDLYAPLRALPGFCLGLTLYANRDLLKGTRHAPLALWILLAAASLAAISGAPAVIAVPLFYLVGVAAMTIDVRKEAIGLIRRMAPLGQLTYSIYLWHGFFITVLLNAVADKLFHGNAIVLAAASLATIAGILVWSYLSWRYFETPARRWIDGLVPPRPAAPSPKKESREGQ